MAEKWIAGAVSKHPGKFSAKAKAAGKSTAEYAQEEAHAPGALGKEARLAQTLMGMHHHADGGVISSPSTPKAHLVIALTGHDPSSGSDEDIGAVERAMANTSRSMQEMQARRYRPVGEDPNDSDEQQRIQRLAEIAMQMRHAKHYCSGGVSGYADGGVVAGEEQKPAWQRLYEFLAGPLKALHSAGAVGDRPPQPQNEDISYVRRAAEEAGKRNQEEQDKAAAAKSKYGSYPK